MFSDVVLTIRTGPPGAGKSYWCVKDLYNYFLKFYGPNKRYVTNLPLTFSDARVTVKDITLEEMLTPKWEEYRDTVLILDEAQKWLTSKTEDHWVKFIGEARHYGIRIVLLTQVIENIPDRIRAMCELWYESANGRSERDPYIQLFLYDWSCLWAKLTGRWCSYFICHEKRKVDRRWKTQDTRREWFDKRIGALYNSKNVDSSDNGSNDHQEDWQRFGWRELLLVIHARNPGAFFNAVVLSCKTFVPVGLGLLFFGGGLRWLSASSLFGPGATPPPAAVAPAAVPPPIVHRPALAERHVEVSPHPPAPVKPQRGKVAARVVTWLLLCCCVMGCAVRRSFGVPETQPSEHIARKPRAVTADPRVALAGAGHSLDDVASAAGFESASAGLVFDGPTSGKPVVGRDVVDKIRADHSLAVEGNKLVPARPRWVTVPDELSDEELDVPTFKVGGKLVAKVSQVDLDRWRDVSDVRHECYATEFLIVSVSASDGRSLALGAGGQGAYSVTYPAAGWSPWSTTAVVTITADGSWLRGREVAKPLLRAPHGESATVHVGSKYPYRVASATTNVGQSTTTIGATVQNIVTGTEVTSAVTRISQTQVGIKGQVKISATNGTNDGIPITTERSASIGQVIDLGQEWRLAARLDSASVSRSGKWFGLGAVTSGDDQTFVVFVRCVQDVHTDVATVVDRPADPVAAAKLAVSARSLPAVEVVPEVSPEQATATAPTQTDLKGFAPVAIPSVPKSDPMANDLPSPKAAEAAPKGTLDNPVPVIDKATGRPVQPKR